MATQGGTSRLGQMQMQFQQKLQKMQDQKRNELISPTGLPTAGTGGYYRTTTSLSSTSTNSGGGGGGVGISGSPATNSGGGKVRQLFEERRQRGIGIDKSYPLQPISSTSTTTTTTNGKKSLSSLDNARVSQRNTRFSSTRTVTRSLPGGGHQTTTTTTRTLTTSSKFGPGGDTNNNNGHGLDQTDLGGSFARSNGLNGKLAGLSISNEINNNNSGGGGPGSIKLKPVNLKSSTSARTLINGGGSPGTTATTTGKRTTSVTVANNNGTDRQTSPTHRQQVVSPVKSASKLAPKTLERAGETSENGCRICGRCFNEDRLAKHEAICEKSKAKKRKVFDTTKHRVKGTDAESYVVGKKGRSSGNAPAATKTIAGVVVKTDAKKGNWRKKHEEFIAAIRAAKEMQAHLAKGGKLSDLPPPPPSENPDYIQCPHCNRRFNEAAATRHIPKCATMLHNKPKAAPPKKRF